jgi:hypothetical protein
LRELGTNDHFYRYRSKESSLDVSPTVRLLKIARSRIASPDGAIFTDGAYDSSSEAFQITTRLMDRFHADILENGSLPLILLFPSREDLKRHRNQQIARHAPLVDHLTLKGYPYLDLVAAFDGYGSEHHLNDLFARSHYSALTNGFVAEHISSYLRARGLTDPDAIATSRDDLASRVAEEPS